MRHSRECTGLRPKSSCLVPRDTPTRVLQVIARIAKEDDIRDAVELNHDNNRWWPISISDWRVRIAVAGWSTRISYNMIGTYAAVASSADQIGYQRLRRMPDEELRTLLLPIGLSTTRVQYFRSLVEFLDCLSDEGIDPRDMPVDHFISRFVTSVHQASYKVAQCAALYSRGYHCGVIPVDSGMVSALAPRLGLHLSKGAIAHEEMRQILEACVREHAASYRHQISELGYAITLPDEAIPTWWVHLVLIYFKRLYCNRPSSRLCCRQPMCDKILDCSCHKGTPSLR